ncbi:MAG: ABC transporter ATP-binding protein [Pirellulaceae bacterium]|nr:ABC transporter ATP-binding protein [Pirellulaceae bacterium]
MIRLENVTIRAGRFELRDVQLEVESGQYVALMGRTGCGKTTMLEAICGLRSVSAGRIVIGNQDVTDAAPGDRRIGYVPQDLALFPTMTVAQHLGFALQLQRQSRAEIQQRTQELAQQLAISHLLQRYPAGLSGGEAQRVALGRALAFRPPLLLLDEPLSALDDQTRSELIEHLSRIKHSRSVTVLHITHNQSEAQSLADRIVRLADCCRSG